MRKIILAGLALLSLGVMDARAAEPDTSRVPLPTQPRREEPAEFAVGDMEGAVIQLAGDARDRYADRGRYPSQERYDDRYDDRRGSQYDVRVRVWLDNDRDILRPGDRTRVLVRTTEDAYVAVVHIDTNGDVEFLYPYSPYDEGYLRGGRTYALPTRAGGYLRVSGGYGVGYVFAIASTEPLDYRRFQNSWYRGNRWDASHNITGDPFYAMERYEHELVRDVDYGYHDTDYYSYHVGRRYTYPRYACYDGYGPWYSSRSTYWGTCDRVRVLLLERPYYYDTRYWRGDRRYYYRRIYGDRYYVNRRDRDRDPQHGYKDDRGGNGSAVPPLRRQGASGSGSQPRDLGGTFRRGEGDDQQEPRVTRPTERTRPTFGRRSEPEPREEPSRRAEPVRREEPRQEPVRRAEPRDEPRRAAPPERRSEPERRAEPARRSDPPPARAEPRSEPRSSPPPQRESSPPSRSGGDGPRARPF
jgi:hypothetical protein